MLLPIKSQNPPESFPFGTVGLILTNVAVYIGTSNGLTVDKSIVDKYGLTPQHCTATTLVTHMFVHPDLYHIIGNMWFLYLFGFAVEGRLRTAKFLILYLLSGLAAAGLHLALRAHGGDAPLIGASGAIMGTLGAALYLFPHSLVLFLYGIPPMLGGFTPWRTYWVAVYYVAIDLLGGALQRVAVVVGPAYFAHFGGVVAGALVCFVLRSRRDSMDTSDAKAMYSGVKDLRFLSVHELASMAQADPTNTTVVLNWTTRSVTDFRGITPECLSTFMGLLPKIIEREQPAAVGNVLAGLSTKGHHVPSATMVLLAARLERSGDARSAASLYDAVIKDLESDAGDQEAAFFRLGMLCETRFGNPQQACEFYVEVTQRFPMGGFADQAKIRLAALGFKGGP
jgi:membrane associated rhomboid family serine protease